AATAYRTYLRHLIVAPLGPSDAGAARRLANLSLPVGLTPAPGRAGDVGHLAFLQRAGALNPTRVATVSPGLLPSKALPAPTRVDQPALSGRRCESRSGVATGGADAAQAAPPADRRHRTRRHEFPRPV